jgi:excisionase family DNA binding protein
MTENLLSTGEVALRLRLSSEYVRTLANAGRLPVRVTAGGRRLFDRRDVEKLAAKRASRKRPTTPLDGGKAP